MNTFYLYQGSVLINRARSKSWFHKLFLVMLLFLNTVASLVETTEITPNDPVAIASTVSIALGFAAIHIWSDKIHRLLYLSEHLAASFSGGMAISYVFINLLPELETAEEVLGHSIHFVILIGFLLFYSLQSLVWQSSSDRQSQHRFVFGIELFFYCLYNGLLIYTIPEQVNRLLTSGFPYIIAIGFHLLHNDYTFTKKYNQLFIKGRYLLVATIAVACGLNLIAEPIDQLVSDCLIALLAGSIMFNIFYEELPSPKSSQLQWFLAGVIVYTLLRVSSLSIV